jgi:hypothetical protein
MAVKNGKETSEESVTVNWSKVYQKMAVICNVLEKP